MSKQIKLYSAFLIGIMAVAVSYCVTSNTLGTKYGSVFQFFKIISFCFALGLIILDSGKRWNSLSLKKIDVLLLGMVAWNCFSTYINGKLSITTFIDISLWPFVFICSEKYGKKILFFDSIKKPIFFISFVLILFSIPNLITRYSGLDKAGYAIGATYSTLMLLPFLLSLKKDNVQKILILIIVLVALISTKRTAFLSITTGLASYLLLDAWISQKKEKTKKIVRRILLCFVLGVIIYIFINRMNLDILDRLNSISEDGGSGRIDIWESVIIGFRNSTLTQKLFGHGYHSVVTLRGRGQLAHNDYLEILYDYGVIGLFFAIMFVFTLILRVVKLCKEKNPLLPVYILSMIFFLMFSMVSYLMVQSLRILFLVAFLGMVDPIVKTVKDKESGK